ncbi:MAG: DMT family transporter [Bacteriovoracaceae bacterium]
MAYAQLILSVIILSQAPNLVKLAQAPAVIICFWRLFLAAVFLGLIGLYTGKMGEIKRLSSSQWKMIVLTSVVLFIHFILWFMGVHKTSVANASIIFATNPLFTAIGSYLLFGEKISVRYLIAMALGLTGIVVTFSQNMQFHPEAFLGDMLVLVSAIFFSGYILLSKKARHHTSNVPFTFILNLLTAGCSLMTILVLDLTKGASSFTSLFNHSDQNWWAFILMAIFPSILGHALFTHTLKYLNVNLMSTTMLLSPVLASIVSYFFYHETVGSNTILGFLITALGVFSLYFPGLKNFLSSRKKKASL